MLKEQFEVPLNKVKLMVWWPVCVPEAFPVPEYVIPPNVCAGIVSACRPQLYLAYNFKLVLLKLLNQILFAITGSA